MIQVIWTYTVKPERVAEFEIHYAPDGAWVRLFQRAAGYGGTTLLRDAHSAGRYATIDRWETMESFERFKREFRAAYAELDQQCSAFTIDEQQVGTFVG